MQVAITDILLCDKIASTAASIATESRIVVTLLTSPENARFSICELTLASRVFGSLASLSWWRRSGRRRSGCWSWRWGILGQANICAILPNLRGLFAVPSPREEVLALLKTRRDHNLVHDTPIWHILAESGVATHRGIELSARRTDTVSLGRSCPAATPITINLSIPRIVITTTRFIRWNWGQRCSTMLTSILAYLATRNWTASPLTSCWPRSLTHFGHGKLEGRAIGADNEGCIASELQRGSLETFL